MSAPAALCIMHARSIDERVIVRDSWVLVRDGIIQKTGTGRPPQADAMIDARGNYLAPGCIDLHIHGDSARISRQAVRGGTTGFLRSLCAADPAGFCAIIEREKKSSLSGAQRIGFHLEGPFLNPVMAGAQPAKALQRPTIRLLRRLPAYCGREIRIMTLAPELPGSPAVIRDVCRRGMVAALGHSEATYEESLAAIDGGASLATHCYNRMSAQSSRQPGLITAVLLDDRITAEVVCDGIHVHPALIRLLLKNKPPDKVVLVTDSVRAERGLKKRLCGGVYRLPNGTMCGSRLTMLEAVRNAIRFGGIGLVQAMAMATANPARVLGLDARKGKIKPGFDADLIIFDKNFNCLITVVSGKVVFERSN